MSMAVDHWDEEAGDWRPDEWDDRVGAVIAERDRVADSIDGPVPLLGTPDWVSSDANTKAVAQARFERERAVARGKEISDRMAVEGAERSGRVEAEKQIGAGLARVTPLPRQLVEQREAEAEWRKTQPRPSDLIPAQRDRTSEAVRQARETCHELAARRDEPNTRVHRGGADEDGAVRSRF